MFFSKRVMFLDLFVRVAVLPKCRAGPHGMLGVCLVREGGGREGGMASSHRAWSDDFIAM